MPRIAPDSRWSILSNAILLVVYDYFNAAYAPLLQLHHLKCIVQMVYLLMDAQEVALNLKQKSCQRISIALYVGKLVIVNLQDAAEITKKSLALKQIGVVVQLGVGLLLIIKLIVYLTDYLLKDVLKGYDTAGTTELIDNDGNVYLVFLELAQQVVNLLCLGNKIRRPYKALPSE